MTFSFSKFLNLIHSQKIELNESELDNLFEVIFSSTFTKSVNTQELSEKIKTISKDKAFDILSQLSNADIIEPVEFLCSGCGEIVDPVSLDENKCVECDTVIDKYQRLYFKIPSVLDKKSIQIIQDKFRVNRQLERYIENWEHSGTTYYMITDLVSSQKVQAKDNLEFNRFLKNLRHVWKYSIFSQLQRSYFPFGEIGDAYKIAFSSVDDAIYSLKRFAVELEENPKFYEFPSIKESIEGSGVFFPRFTALVGDLGLPKTSRDENIPLKDVISVTLNNGIDFVSSKLTELFRLESAGNVNKSIYEEYFISIWITKNALEHSQLKNRIPEATEAKKLRAMKDDVCVAESDAYLLFMNKDMTVISMNPNTDNDSEYELSEL